MRLTVVGRLAAAFGSAAQPESMGVNGIGTQAADCRMLESSQVRRGLWLATLALTACVTGRQPELAPRPSPDAAAATGPGAAASPISLADAEYLRARRLAIPVANVAAVNIPDTFGAGRGARTHQALDIRAPRGTPVLSADAGRVIRLRTNPAGGITIYAVDEQDRFVYYYAHLERYRDGLAEGMKLARGDTIGYVGTTGNSPPNTPHLHFQLMRRGSGTRYWEGTPIDPRPFLVPDRTIEMTPP